MLPTQRPRSAPGPSIEAQTSEGPFNRADNLSLRWTSAQRNHNSHHEHSSFGSSRRTPEDLLRETNPWARKTLLCLDGGGVRGYSSLLILRALMLRIMELERHANPGSRSSAEPLVLRPRRPVQVNIPRTQTASRTESSEVAAATQSSSLATYLPAHYFDYLAGTSTGGSVNCLSFIISLLTVPRLIAIMLGRLHMTVDECLATYEKSAERVFGHPRRFHIRKPPWIPRDKYNHEPLERVIKEIVTQRNPSGSGSTPFRQPNESMCRT